MRRIVLLMVPAVTALVFAAGATSSAWATAPEFKAEVNAVAGEPFGFTTSSGPAVLQTASIEVKCKSSSGSGTLENLTQTVSSAKVTFSECTGEESSRSCGNVSNAGNTTNNQIVLNEMKGQLGTITQGTSSSIGLRLKPKGTSFVKLAVENPGNCGVVSGASVTGAVIGEVEEKTGPQTEGNLIYQENGSHLQKITKLDGGTGEKLSAFGAAPAMIVSETIKYTGEKFEIT